MKALRTLVYGAVAALLLAVCAATALWVWSGSDTSLATGLAQVARWLPAGQTLQARDVSGSLRAGGRIGSLQWQQGELRVEVSDLTLAWSLRPLLQREVRLNTLKVTHLRIEDHRPPSTATPTPPTDLRLPLAVSLPFEVATLTWVGPPALVATGLAGRYIFNSDKHNIDVAQVHISSGTYRLQASVEALAPMALFAQLDGRVQTQVPNTRQGLSVRAHASLKGALAETQAALALQAELVPSLDGPTGSASRSKDLLQASVSAQIQPWQVQTISRLQARWQGLDLGSVWPQAPQTRLSGVATVSPEGAAWQAAVQVSNGLSGSWDKQRLPLTQLSAQLAFNQGQWTLESLQAAAAGGRLEAQGQLSASAGAPHSPDHFGWQGKARAVGMNTAELDSRLAATRLDGQLSAHQTPKGIAFDATLQPSPGQTAVKRLPAGKSPQQDGLHLKSAQIQGMWQAPKITLSSLTVQTDDAQLQGHLSLDTTSRATEGELAVDLPGANLTLAGQLASDKGLGDWRVRLSNATLAARWLARLPGAPAALGQNTLDGAAELIGHWQGGWQQGGEDLQLQASLRAPSLDFRPGAGAAAPPWRLRDLQADVNGRLSALSLRVRGQAETGTQRISLQAQAQGGRRSANQWQGTIDTVQVVLDDSQQPGRWTVQLNDSLALGWQRTDSTQTLDIAPGGARISGPMPGQVNLNWQAANLSQRTTTAGTSTQWRTQGQLTGLPLAWLDWLGQRQMANLGLRGDLLLGGQWDASQTDTLKLRATLERSKGDLLLQPEDTSAGTLRAGLREARLNLSADGEQVSASLRWDSERAGQAQASFSTRLQDRDGRLSWPADAPLNGQLRTQLPPVGAWSLLAPPGWRLRGTLDADAELSGTRGAPQWRGRIAAQDLAARSVADGIDFSQGSLRARLDGQRLEIEDFTLRGAGGASGGQLVVKGSVVWLPALEPQTSVLSRVRMALSARAQALRLSARADRRLSVSGDISAGLADTTLTIRGKLKTDSALFILPEDSAPQLGEDVVVRKAGTPPANTAAARPPAPGSRITPDVVITLDLGDDFLVRGLGLATRLAGNLELRSAARNPLSITGTLRTERGTYKAYGQQLDIERGVMRFSGPYDNPTLEILAIRPNLQQRVGVQISGSVLSPVVRLYAEPELPDADKLAWLVLGRGGASGGAESALLQQAALTLLGGRGKGLSAGLAEALGLDELSVRGSASTTTGTTGATVVLGKRVSRDFYLAYERSLSGALGTLYIFYDLSRRLTLRAQTGEQSAIDLIFTLRYD
jgi:translocation and assembly module TamB